LTFSTKKGVLRVEEEIFRIPVDVRGSKTSVLKLAKANHDGDGDESDTKQKV